MSKLTVKIKKLNSEAMMPTKAHETDTGWDVGFVGPTAKTIQPGQSELLPTGLAIELPESFGVAIRTRSSASRKGLHIEGTVDNGYRGEVYLRVWNMSDVPVTVLPGERYAQLVIERVFNVNMIEVTELTPTARGAGGFGSTGK